MTRKIITERVNPPIPTTAYDWSATLDDYEPGHPIGWGATEAGAIRDLEAQIEEDGSSCPQCGADLNMDYGYCRSCAEVVR